jgi:hypothetical protein
VLKVPSCRFQVDPSVRYSELFGVAIHSLIPRHVRWVWTGK